MNYKRDIKKDEVVDYDIKILDDGTVRVTQRIEKIYEQPYRDFLSEFREMKKSKEEAEKILSDDYKNKVKDDIETIKKRIKELKPYIEESEKKSIEFNENKKRKAMVDKLKEELNKPMAKINMTYMGAVWDNLMRNEEEVMQMLNEEEIEKFRKIKTKKIKSDMLKRRTKR